MAAPEPEGLDLAVGWLQRNIDELAEVTRRVQDLAPPATPSRAPTGPAAAVGPAPATAPATSPPAPVGSTTPLLDHLGRDLTKLARDGSLTPIIGRDTEMDWLIEVLCRTEKRNPVLLGPAGAGKTAIVEGLAQRIAAGKVPALLKGARIIEVPLGGLVAGTQYRGQLEERLQQVLAEASQPGIILFFDEIHLLAGVGHSEGGIGAAELLKPALARGDIAVIGATTPEAYRSSIEQDSALARRFTTISVTELDRDQTRPILQSVRDALGRVRGVTVTDAALDVLLHFADTSITNRRFPDKALDLLQQTVAQAVVENRTTVDEADAVRTTQIWAERASSSPTLERFGRDLIRLAKDGKLGPIVGRDREIQAIIEILIRHSKRNPILLGPAGSGKTAIVEGLAIRIASGDVPQPLQEVRLFDVSLTALASAIATEPSTIQDFLLEARHPSVILFLDEIHVIASPAARQIGEALKPALARGEIACIGATTGEEYQASIEPETALARRFTPVAVEPMDAAGVRSVMVSVAASLGKLRGIEVRDSAIDLLIGLADRFLPNRSFPDKGVDVLEQSVAYAVANNLSVVDDQTARAAIAAMVGMPLDPTASLASLSAEITERGLLEPAAATALVARLQVTQRGLDAGQRQPDAVVLLYGAAAGAADALSETVARTLFGRSTAVVSVELSGMTGEESISSLLGSAPGLVGSDRPLPMQELRRAPWQVLLLRGIDRCAGEIRETVAAALAAGQFTDAMGRAIPLGSTVAILNASALDPGVASPDVANALLRAALGPSLVDACDVITGAVGSGGGSDRAGWIRSQLLEPLAGRFHQQGYEVSFDAALVSWVDQHLPTDGGAPDGFIDRTLAPALAAGLAAGQQTYLATIADDHPVLRARLKETKRPRKA
jgi:ATP-dependent Clp protease ATP-binding subunit ClpC